MTQARSLLKALIHQLLLHLKLPNTMSRNQRVELGFPDNSCSQVPWSLAIRQPHRVMTGWAHWSLSQKLMHVYESPSITTQNSTCGPSLPLDDNTWLFHYLGYDLMSVNHSYYGNALFCYWIAWLQTISKSQTRSRKHQKWAIKCSSGFPHTVNNQHIGYKP